MKRNLSILGMSIFLIMLFQNTALAETSPTQTPVTNAILNFEIAYSPQYDQINENLMTCTKMAKAWSPDATFYEFHTTNGLDNPPGYVFGFLNPNNRKTTYRCGVDNWIPFSQTPQGIEEERIPDPGYGIYNVKMRLRDLLLAMKNNQYLLPKLNQLMKTYDIEIAPLLVKNSKNQLIWKVYFVGTRDNSTNPNLTYLVTVSAETLIKPVFSIKQD